MRLEIIIPDSTREDVKTKVARLAQRLSDCPELIRDLKFEDDDIQAMFTPERLAHIDRALAEVDAGRSYTASQVEDYFAEKERSWDRQHA